jgi:methylmalonyl-CoA carboxyltransferase large subunit
MSQAIEPPDNADNADNPDNADTVAELKALVAELAARVQTLEEQADQRHPEVSEEVLLAIAAACAAYLGKRAIVRQVHLRRGSTWAATGRAAAQQMHADLHGYGDRQTTLTPHARRGTT